MSATILRLAVSICDIVNKAEMNVPYVMNQPLSSLIKSEPRWLRSKELKFEAKKKKKPGKKTSVAEVLMEKAYKDC